MNETLIGILGGVIGSLITVIVTKILEIKQKKIEHKASLKKEFFTKKVAALEKATGQGALLISALGNLSSLFKLLPEDDIEFDEQIELSLYSSIDAQLQRASDATYELANSVVLYMDFDKEELWDFEPIEQLLRLYGEIGNLKAQSDLYYEYLETNRGTTIEKEIENDISKIQDKVKEKAYQITNLFDSFKSTYATLLQSMRNEMKKYED